MKLLRLLHIFFIGKYMQMMNLLKPIAFDVMQSMSQLFDFYLYTVKIDEREKLSYDFFLRRSTRFLQVTG